MQKVEIYYSLSEAKHEMENFINKGWRIHTCTMGSYLAGYSGRDHILVVYER